MARSSEPHLDWGRPLRLLSARDNLSTKELAKRMGLPNPSYLSMLRTGARKNPGSDVLLGIAKVFKCSVADIVSLAEGKGGVDFGR